MNHRRHLTALFALLLVAACADDNQGYQGPQDPLDAFEPGLVDELDCRPQLDGIIDADQLQPVLGVPLRYRVSPASHTRPVNLAGFQDQLGVRVWDFRAIDGDYAGDQALEIVATEIDARWYADHYDGAQFTTILDPTLGLDAVYSHDGDTLYLHGYASREENPDTGQTLVVYQEPVTAYAFPLAEGDQWTSVGTVHDGRVRGLPYSGTETYEFRIDATGELWLPQLTFEKVLRVRTALTIETPIGQPTYREQVQFLFECFGEVMRLVGPSVNLSDEFSPDDYTLDEVVEMRRLGL